MLQKENSGSFMRKKIKEDFVVKHQGPCAWLSDDCSLHSQPGYIGTGYPLGTEFEDFYPFLTWTLSGLPFLF